MTRGTADVPVVIVGAGPTGLAAAIMLARRGIASLVLERHEQPYPLPRAVHVDDEVMRILQDLGVAEEFAAVSRPALGLRLLAADHRVIAEFRRDRASGLHGHPQSSLFDQPDLERLLRAELARHPQARLRTGAEVTGIEQDDESRIDDESQPGGACLTGAGRRPGDESPIDDESQPDGGRRGGPVRVRYRLVGDGPGNAERSVTAEAVLGCDGANSLVRELIGAGLDDLGFEERWLVLDVRCAVPLPVWGGVDQVCDPRRATTVMRIGTDRYRWEFRLHPGESVAELTAPQRLRSLLAPWAGSVPDGGLQVVRAAEYTFRARLADRWRRGRVFLLGDSAHQTPPFVGQGLGSGLRDASNLIWKLALVLDPTAPPGREAAELLLDTYQAERRPHARALIRLAVVAGWAMTGGQDRAATLRRVLLAGFCRLPGATGLILDRGGPPLVPGPLVLRSRPTARLLSSVRLRRPFRDPAGTLVPQPWVDRAGSSRRLDSLLGPGFAVLSDGPLHPALVALAARLGALVLQLDDTTGSRTDHPTPAGDTTVTGGEVLIGSPPLRRWLAARGTAAVLLRPDRVVLAAAPRTGPGVPAGAEIAAATITSHLPALLGIGRPLG